MQKKPLLVEMDSVSDITTADNPQYTTLAEINPEGN